MKKVRINSLPHKRVRITVISQAAKDHFTKEESYANKPWHLKKALKASGYNERVISEDPMVVEISFSMMSLQAQLELISQELETAFEEQGLKKGIDFICELIE